MKAGSGKAKGAEFERFVCEKLSLWVSHEKRTDLFWRSAMSGGRATVKFKKGGHNDTQAGDITALAEESFIFSARFSVECKFYADLNLQQGLFKGTGNIANFWREHAALSTKAGKLPLLIAKQNRLPVVCVSSGEGVEVLTKFTQPFLASSLLDVHSTCAFFWFSNLLATRYNPGPFQR